MGTRKRHSAEFKAKIALLAIKGEDRVNEIAQRYQLHPSQVTQWKQQALSHLAELFSKGSSRSEKDEAALKDHLYQEIGQLKVELDFLKKKFGSPG